MLEIPAASHRDKCWFVGEGPSCYSDSLRGPSKRTQHDQGNHVLLGTLKQAHGKVMFHTNILSISSLYGIMIYEICPSTRLHLHYAHQDASTKNKLISISGNWGMETHHSCKWQTSFHNHSQLQTERKIGKPCPKDQNIVLTHQYEVAMNLFLVFSH